MARAGRVAPAGEPGPQQAQCLVLQAEHCVAVDAASRFLDALSGVTDPEVKRKMIGKVFIDVFEAEADKLGQVDFLAQGTLYPDVIESVSATGGPSATEVTTRPAISSSRPASSPLVGASHWRTKAPSARWKARMRAFAAS